MKQGIEISMRSMNQVHIDPGGSTATIGGGVISKEVMDALWAANKRTGIFPRIECL
jgi:FAD/FMN-containing dehydrogenase